MDDQVRAAMARWPNVPDCRGWLALDARGDWYMRDEAVQALGGFPTVKGSRVEHEKLREFIERNYARHDSGAWYFQNGPQRVFVDLEAAPWVWRLREAADPERATSVRSHTGRSATVASCWLDERGRLFLDSDIGFGIVHSLDMEAASDLVEEGRWEPKTALFDDLQRTFGYRLSAG